MALAYAFLDETGRVYGEESSCSPQREFPYVPVSGPFAGQYLRVHASGRESGASGTWLAAPGGAWGCYATGEVESLLAMTPPAQLAQN